MTLTVTTKYKVQNYEFRLRNFLSITLVSRQKFAIILELSLMLIYVPIPMQSINICTYTVYWGTVCGCVCV